MERIWYLHHCSGVDHHPARSSVASSPNSARPTILLVDDDDAVRRSLQLLLEAAGYQVRAYASSISAAADPHARTCNCLVADLMLPGLDGIALLGTLRRSGWTGRAILISGLLDDNEIEAGSAAGFDLIFSKPTSDSVLTRALAQLLRGELTGAGAPSTRRIEASPAP